MRAENSNSHLAFKKFLVRFLVFLSGYVLVVLTINHIGAWTIVAGAGFSGILSGFLPQIFEKFETTRDADLEADS